jgi:hypothetical protein
MNLKNMKENNYSIDLDLLVLLYTLSVLVTDREKIEL